MMAYHHTASSSVPAGTAPSHDAARGQRTNQVQYIKERLRNDISPAAAAGITALLAQLETQSTLPSIAHLHPARQWHPTWLTGRLASKL